LLGSGIRESCHNSATLLQTSRTVDARLSALLRLCFYPREITKSHYFNGNFVQLTCRSVAAIVFDARVFHRSGDNRSGHWRHALTMNACHWFMKQLMDSVRFVPTTIADSLDEEAKCTLGFYTRVPSNLDEFFLPEAQRLYRADQG